MTTTDGLFSCTSVKLPFKNGQTWHLLPFGDVHADASAHSKSTWADFCQRAKSLDNVLFLGMGDYLDSYSCSERRILGNPDIHETTRQREEKAALDRVMAFARSISFMRDRCIGILSGNHFPSFSDGTTGDQHIARALNAKYLGVCAAIQIAFRSPCRSRSVSVDIFAHHGRGAGKTTGGRMGAVDDLQRVCEADIFLMGHNHARGALPVGDKLRLQCNNTGLYIKSRRAWIGRTGSFLKAYEPGERNYVVDRALPPASLGWIEFELTPRRLWTDGGEETAVEIHGRQ